MRMVWSIFVILTLNNTGQLGGTWNIDINAPEA